MKTFTEQVNTSESKAKLNSTTNSMIPYPPHEKQTVLSTPL